MEKINHTGLTEKMMHAKIKKDLEKSIKAKLRT
jgi:hypothetical protein